MKNKFSASGKNLRNILIISALSTSMLTPNAALSRDFRFQSNAKPSIEINMGVLDDLAKTPSERNVNKTIARPTTKRPATIAPEPEFAKPTKSLAEQERETAQQENNIARSPATAIAIPHSSPLTKPTPPVKIADEQPNRVATKTQQAEQPMDNEEILEIERIFDEEYEDFEREFKELAKKELKLPKNNNASEAEIVIEPESITPAEQSDEQQFAAPVDDFEKEFDSIFSLPSTSSSETDVAKSEVIEEEEISLEELLEQEIAAMETAELGEPIEQPQFEDKIENEEDIIAAISEDNFTENDNPPFMLPNTDQQDNTDSVAEDNMISISDINDENENIASEITTTAEKPDWQQDLPSLDSFFGDTAENNNDNNNQQDNNQATALVINQGDESDQIKENFFNDVAYRADGTELRVTFKSDETEVPVAAYKSIQNLASELSADQNKIVILQGYATGAEATTAKRISLARVYAVRGLLIENGVADYQIRPVAYGNKNEGTPQDRVDIVFDGQSS